jgi:uncharacterized membrane protein
MDKRDNTLVWVIIALLGLIVVQMFGTLKIKEELKQCKGVKNYSNER